MNGIDICTYQLEDTKYICLRNRKEKSGTAATLDVLLESLPTRSELFVEKVKVDSKRCQIKREKLTQNDCRNTTTKRANRIIKNEIKSFQV